MINRFSRKQKMVLASLVVVLSVGSIISSVYFLNRQRYDIRSRAEDGNCTPVGNQILMSPNDSASCLTLRGAINAIPDNSNYTIRFQPGNYQVGENIEIADKNVIITGDSESGSKAVTINFTGQINIKGSSVAFEWLQLRANNEDSLVSGSGLKELTFKQTHLSNASGSVIELTRTDFVNIINTEIMSSNKAGTFNEIANLTINNSKVHDNNAGITVSNSAGNIVSNVITGQSENGLVFTEMSTFSIASNTFFGNKNTAISLANNDSGQGSYFEMLKNIISDNNTGISTTNITLDAMTFKNNDVWNNGTDFAGIESIVGENGNISEDPQFGSFYCLNSSSPAIYGDLNRGEFMGYKRFNEPLCN